VVCFPKRALLVHGFNVADGGVGTVGTIEPAVKTAGFTIGRFPYGKLGVLGVRFFNDNLAQALAWCIMDGEFEVVIGHSNGCALIHQALWHAEEFGCKGVRAVYISPALDRDAPLSPCVTRADVLTTVHDKAVRLAALLPFHAWGSMGAKGPAGYEQRYIHHPCPEVKGHSAWFKPPALDGITRPLVERILREEVIR
jgi:hypothetical protein